MLFKHSSSFIVLIASSMFLMGCGATALVSTPVENIDTVPLKVMELTDAEKKVWGHTDLLSDTIPGMSIDRAYNEIIGNKRGKTVIVAVLDSGMDLDHEDLDDVLWTNTDEKPGNGKDDDNNGYIDDIHGYNFLGESYNEQLEYARMLRLNVGSAGDRAKAQVKLDKKYPEVLQNKQQYEQILQVVTTADKAVKKELGKDSYTKEELLALKPTTEQMQQNVAVLSQMYQYADTIDDVMSELNEGVTYFTEQVNYNLNKEFDGRSAVGDNPYDINSRGYGNGNPKNRFEDESHGTHVAGIIAAERNNGKGANGVAKNVKLMSIRAVPNGDEYDKDIALGIRYAVDNGAKIINCSFGKSFSPNAEWVYEAIKYASSKDVLIVHAAGNDGNDLDSSENPNYPNDHRFQDSEISDNVITVGALAPSYGSKMVATFSNYGKANVDVFAPGDDIYSTMPDNKYDFNGGTSMAAPAVAGIAALIRSYYPSLTASQVKKVLMQSGLRSKASVILSGEPSNSKPFSDVSKSGRMVNAYNALIMAQNISKGKMILDSSAQ
ncbi:S8 family peptidase [uncultured Croceitalea sp.]|uniref:S8 family peptidase n=1 Tax=uncultured Croceitalea sp. TaxID=1798908 RepID=UPI0033062349